MAKPFLSAHPKLMLIAHELEIPRPHALGHLAFLWLAGYNSENSIDDIELACEWEGQKGALTRALLSAEIIEATSVRGKFRYRIPDLSRYVLACRFLLQAEAG